MKTLTTKVGGKETVWVKAVEYDSALEQIERLSKQVDKSDWFMMFMGFMVGVVVCILVVTIYNIMKIEAKKEVRQELITYELDYSYPLDWKYTRQVAQC